jgi:hypothetical protein
VSALLAGATSIADPAAKWAGVASVTRGGGPAMIGRVELESSHANAKGAKAIKSKNEDDAEDDGDAEDDDDADDDADPENDARGGAGDDITIRT